MCLGPHLSWDEVGAVRPVWALRWSFFADRSRAVLLWIICIFVSLVSHAFASVHCCLVVSCWERADLLVVMFIVFLLLSLVTWVRCGT